MGMKNRIAVWICKGRQNIVVMSILLNLIYLLSMLIFFDPFFSIDDYLMSNIAYGVYGADYDYQLTYMNFWYGRVIVFLLRLFPKIPWYTVLFNVWIFMALTLLTYVILKWSNNYAGMLLSNLLLLFFSYEGYVAIQFTKVAGMLAASALLVLFSEQLSWKPKVLGVGLWILSCMIRQDCAKMVIGIWALLLIWKEGFYFFTNKKFSIQKSAKRSTFFLLSLCIFFLVPKISSAGLPEEEKDFWRLYWKHNAIRSALQDYSVPDYETYKEAYKVMGITKNDLHLFWSWNWDCSVITLEKGEIIQAMREGDNEKVEELLLMFQFGEYYSGIGKGEKEDTLIVRQTEKNCSISGKKTEIPIVVVDLIDALALQVKKIFNIDRIMSYFKIFPRVFLKIDVWVVYFIMLLLVPICWGIRKRDWCKGVLMSAGMLLLLNYYLYINGRYLQHRADVGIVFVVIVTFLLLITEQEYSLVDREGRKKWAFAITVCLLLNGKYIHWSDDYQTPNKQSIALNQIFFKETANDTEHYYVTGRNRELGSMILVFSKNAYDIPKIGVMQNVLRGNSILELLKEDNYFIDMIDNENKYFIMANTDQNETAWEIYFTEHSGTKTELVLVKQFLGKKIYRVRSKAVRQMVDVSEMTESIDVKAEKTEYKVSKSKLEFFGTAYLSDENGFSQNAYIQIVDSRTGEYELYDTLASCDETKSYGDEGYFAKLFAEIELPDFYNQNSKINLVIEQDGKFYYKQINPRH